ncbi:MAG: hypothetical protein QXW01_00440 [Candidatus Aenigmatarchaeota archaeon]
MEKNEFSGFYKLVSIIIISLLLFCYGFGLAENEEKTSSAILWITEIGQWWLFFFIIGITFIFAGLIFGRISYRLRRWLSILGLVIVFIGIFGAELVYVMPFVSQQFGKKSYATKCEALSGTNIIEMVGCIFSGYAPSNNEATTIAVFFIFGVIAPLGILIALFYEFTDFFNNQGVRNVMTFLSALMAFRVLMADLFFELLSYGFAGLGILIVDYFFFMVIFKFMQRFWKGAEMIQEIITYTTEERIAELTRQLKNAEAMLSTLSPNSEQYKFWKKREEEIRKELDELKKEAGKISSQPGSG